MGSDVSHFNGSLVVQGGQNHETVSYNSHFLEEKGEPKRGVEPASVSAYQPSALTTGPSRLTARWYGPQRRNTPFVGTGHTK